METLEQKMDKLELKLQHLELILMRKIMEKEHEEKCTKSNSLKFDFPLWVSRIIFLLIRRMDDILNI